MVNHNRVSSVCYVDGMALNVSDRENPVMVVGSLQAIVCVYDRQGLEHWPGYEEVVEPKGKNAENPRKPIEIILVER